ncbi:MAG: DUF6390 family protein, partial [Candidatus Micrarchaeota archaeon]
KFITGKVKWSLENADNCRVPFGKLMGIGDDGNSVTVSYRPINNMGNKLTFGDFVEKSISNGICGLNFIPEAKVGDWVAFHWDVACKIITDKEKGNLEKYQKLNLF